MSLIHIARNNVVLGQFTAEEIRAGLADGAYLPGDLAWKAGKKNWEPLGEWPEFRTTPPSMRGEGMMPQPPLMSDENALMTPSWERPESGSLFARLLSSTKEIMLSPSETFAAMPREGGMGRPFVFYMIPHAIAAVLASVTMAALVAFGGETIRASEGMKLYVQMGPAGAAVLTCFTQLIAAPLGLFFWSGLLHLMLNLWGAANSGYETTFRTIAYVNGATAVISIPFALFYSIPVIGTLFVGLVAILSIYAMIVSILALMKTHNATGGRVTGAVLTPLLVCCCAIPSLIGVLMAARMHP